METDIKPGTDFLRVSKLQSIKTKILVFALLATIVPSLVLGGLFYLQNSELLESKISNAMRNASVQASGKLELWLKERFYDLRVFASSYVISENVTRLYNKPSSKIQALITLNHIKAYLRSVCDKFAVYDELILINLSGKALLSSTGDAPGQKLPMAWTDQLAAGQPIISDAYLDDRTGLKYLLIAEPIKAGDGHALGYLAAIINLNAVESILKEHCTGGIDEIYLVDAKNRLMVSSHPVPKQFMRTNLPVRTPGGRLKQSTAPASYTGFRDTLVVGMATSVPAMSWVIVAEMEHQNAYAELVQLRRITLALVSGLMLGIGLLAYLFGHSLVRPVRRLSREAARVAGGDLEVDIPVTGLSEVSYLTQVFNHMVSSLRHKGEKLAAANHALRETNKELHQLSITDGLTGLLNRKHIMDLLDKEISRSQRYGHPVTVLLLDIDHFKQVNDTYGHQAGDVVMCRLSEILRTMVRDVDSIGRYGGEEFLILLPESDTQSGAETAERIRKEVQELEIIANQKKIAVTVSIGISSYPRLGADADAVICSADNALYRAKSEGRNRVAISSGSVCRDNAVIHLLADHKRAGERSM